MRATAMENSQLYDALKDHCPDCNGKAHWMRGPEGGACVNVFCGHCGQGFNITPIIGIAERIHKDTRYIPSSRWPQEE
jgi:hypothetical protein